MNMKKLLSIFTVCFIALACHTAQAQLKEDYVGKSWTYQKCEVSNAQDAGLKISAEKKEQLYKGSTLTFYENDLFSWIAKGTTSEGQFFADPQNEDFIILKDQFFESRYKLAMRNYNKELLLVEYFGQKSITYVFTR
jgi:hypothetical protein